MSVFAGNGRHHADPLPILIEDPGLPELELLGLEKHEAGIDCMGVV
jgi:hypothetical protein